MNLLSSSPLRLLIKKDPILQKISERIASKISFQILALDLRGAALLLKEGESILISALEELGSRLVFHFGIENVYWTEGADDFAVIIQGLPVDRVQKKLDRIQEKFSPVKGQSRELRVSAGMASYPDDASSPRELFQKAHLATVEAKRKNSSKIIFYSQIFS